MKGPGSLAGTSGALKASVRSVLLSSPALAARRLRTQLGSPKGQNG